MNWLIDALMNTYTRESGKNLSIEKVKELLLHKVKTQIENEWR